MRLFWIIFYTYLDWTETYYYKILIIREIRHKRIKKESLYDTRYRIQMGESIHSFDYTSLCYTKQATVSRW